MQAAKERKIPVVWYIVPQVWAWKIKRAAVLGDQASFIGTVFPFEVDYFKKYVAPVSFVGHPLVEALETRPVLQRHTVRRFDRNNLFALPLSPAAANRKSYTYCLTMVKAGLLLKRNYPGIRITVSRCRHFSEDMFKKWCTSPEIEISGEPLSDLLSRNRYGTGNLRHGNTGNRA